jgi:hypothetical protein
MKLKLKLKLMAAAVALAASTGAHALIANGTDGNGELFFSIWDANTSYTRDLNYTIDAFESALAAPGLLNLSFAGDAAFNSFLANASGAVKWNIMAADTVGARRMLSTYTTLPSPAKTADVTRSALSNVSNFATQVNMNLGTADSVYITSNTSTAWAGRSSFNDLGAGLYGFSNAGLGTAVAGNPVAFANNSYATGLKFMRINAASTGIAPSTYTRYMEGSLGVNAWLDGNTLHVAAIPEPSEYALMLAGLGMLGFMARRRLSNRG